MIKDIFASLKNCDQGMLYISKRQSDCAKSRGINFHETSHIKPSRKFPNLQYSAFANIVCLADACIIIMSLDVFGISDKARLNRESSATETS